MIWTFAGSAIGLALMGWWLQRPRPEKPETVEDMIAATVTDRLISHPAEWTARSEGIDSGFGNDALRAWVGLTWMDENLVIKVEGKKLDISSAAKRELKAALKGLRKWRNAQDLLNVARAFSERVERAG